MLEQLTFSKQLRLKIGLFVSEFYLNYIQMSHSKITFSACAGIQ